MNVGAAGDVQKDVRFGTLCSVIWMNGEMM